MSTLTDKSLKYNAISDHSAIQKPRLYHRAWASSTRVAHLIHELGVADEIEIKIVEKYPDNLKTPEYKAMHPFGKIPVYKDGEFCFIRKRCNFLYLLDKYSTKATNLKLFTQTNRPFIYQFLFYGTTELYKWSIILYEHYIASDQQRQALQGKVDDLKAKWKIEVIPFLERQLSGKDFLCGEFSAADVEVFYDLGSMQFFGMEISSKVVGDYLERVQKRESYDKAFKN